MLRFAGLIALILLSWANAASADENKSFRATYRLALTFMPNATIEGHAQMSSVRRCSDWLEQSTVSYTIRFNGRIETTVRYETRGEEAADGTRVDRSTQLSVDGQRSETRISGTVAAAGKGGKLQVVENGTLHTFEFPDGVYFPGIAMEKVTSELTAGKTIVSIKTIDISTEPRITDLIVNVIPALPSNAPPPFDPGGLTRGMNWWLQIANRSAERLEAPTMVRMHQNGLYRFMRTKMSGLFVDFVLASVEPLPDLGC